MGRAPVRRSEPVRWSTRPAISADGAVVAFEVASDDAPMRIATWIRSSGATAIVSVSSGGRRSNADSTWPAVSADGRYVAFVSRASNLVAGDTNRTWDIFVRDRVAHTTERVSVTSAGAQANGESGTPSISGDGRYVVFTSLATNLIAGGPRSRSAVYVRDRVAKTTTLVSLKPNGEPSSGDARRPVISTDGRVVAFESEANDIDARATNGTQQIYVRDLRAATTELVSLNASGDPASTLVANPSISGEGTRVAFTTIAANMPSADGKEQVYVRDRAAGETTIASRRNGGGAPNGPSTSPAVSSDGRFVSFTSVASNIVSGDGDGDEDVFVRDLSSTTVSIASIASNEANPAGEARTSSLSTTGRWIAFASEAQRLAPRALPCEGAATGADVPPEDLDDPRCPSSVFVRDRTGGTTTRVRAI